jgi:hypothetical protein
MSPEPIIALQRRLTIAGAIRAGGEKPERGVGKKLEAFRLTSARRDLVEQAARLYGGPVSAWRSPVGEEWQVYTEAESLPVLLMPAYSLRQTYELWEGATKRTRLCDGVEEEISGGPCLCNAEGVDRCDLYSRLVVALPELDSVLGWRLISKGANAAHELPTMAAIAERVGAGSTFVPAQLRLDQRRGVKDGQVVRFVVPVLDLGVGYLALAGGGGLPDGARAALLPPPGTFTPAERAETSVEEALSAVAASPGGGTTTAALGGPTWEPDPAPIPVPADGDGLAPEPPTPTERQTFRRTDAQAKKLDVLVGGMRTAGEITTEHVYGAVSALRGVEAKRLAETLDGIDSDGVLHWAPLRDSLTRAEASELIDRLGALAEKLHPTQAGEFPQGY